MNWPVSPKRALICQVFSTDSRLLLTDPLRKRFFSYKWKNPQVLRTLTTILLSRWETGDQVTHGKPLSLIGEAIR